MGFRRIRGRFMLRCRYVAHMAGGPVRVLETFALTLAIIGPCGASRLPPPPSNSADST